MILKNVTNDNKTIYTIRWKTYPVRRENRTNHEQNHLKQQTVQLTTRYVTYRIVILNPNIFLRVPSIMIFAEGLFHETTFHDMKRVDTGAEINVIKERNLHPNIKINTNNIITIARISEAKIKMIGLVTINYCEHKIQLYVVKITLIA